MQCGFVVLLCWFMLRVLLFSCVFVCLVFCVLLILVFGVVMMC